VKGHIPKGKVNDIGIIVAVWLDPSAGEPSIDWLLKNQKKVGHYFHELALKGEL
jgi:hypothetical protein